MGFVKCIGLNSETDLSGLQRADPSDVFLLWQGSPGDLTPSSVFLPWSTRKHQKGRNRCAEPQATVRLWPPADTHQSFLLQVP